MKHRSDIAIVLKFFCLSGVYGARPVAADAARAENTICLGCGKCAVLRGMDLLEGATTVARNGQIGGHKA